MERSSSTFWLQATFLTFSQICMSIVLTFRCIDGTAYSVNPSRPLSRLPSFSFPSLSHTYKIGTSEGNKLEITWYENTWSFWKVSGWTWKYLKDFFEVRTYLNFEVQVIPSLLENTLNSHIAIFTLFLFSKNQPNLN